MRVVAGLARRTTLVAPEGLHTRPTSDMAKENLFNILQPNIRDASFLDLFSGSGAIGIEALSRGAKEAFFVEQHPKAVAAIQQNLAKCKLQGGHLMAMDVDMALAKFWQDGQQFHMIFMDPPYHIALLNQTLAAINPGLLHPHGMIIAETDRAHVAGNQLEVPAALSITDTRTYGRNCFIFFERGDSS